jgi:hypothetical protein
MRPSARIRLFALAVSAIAMLAWALWPSASRVASGTSAESSEAAVDPARATPATVGPGATSVRRVHYVEPALGSAIVEYEGGLLTVISRGVARSELLTRIARAANLDLEESRPDPTPLDVRIESTPLEQAVPQLLSGLGYALEHRFVTQAGRHVASGLRVDAPPGFAAGEAPGAMNAVGAAAPPSTQRGGADAVHEAREAAQHDQFRALLAQRATTLGQVHQDPDTHSLTSPEAGPGLPSKHGLTRLLASDDAAQVRAAAAFQLGAETGDDVSSALVKALHDDSDLVTLQAIASLVQIGDAGVVPQLSALQQQHRDPNVRAAVARAVDDLRSGRPSPARASRPGSTTWSAGTTM